MRCRVEGSRRVYEICIFAHKYVLYLVPGADESSQKMNILIIVRKLGLELPGALRPPDTP